MIRRCQPKQGDTNPGLGVEMVWEPRLVNQQTINFRFALRRRQRTQVYLLEPQWPALVDNSREFVAGGPNSGSQNFMPSNDDVQRLLYQVDVQCSPKPYCLRLVINRLFGIQLFHKPDPHLVGTERTWERAVSGRNRLIDSGGADFLQQLFFPSHSRIGGRKIVAT